MNTNVSAESPTTNPVDLTGTTVDGYRGIWFTLGQRSEGGDKYSGGLGTYTANHLPMAVYAPAVGRTFFVYGGTRRDGERRLLCMASYYDHESNRVPRPTVVYDKTPVDDPHDNPSINIDADGHLWVFVSGRGRVRPGFKFRSLKPYDVSAFEQIESRAMTYPQLHLLPDGSFLHLFTQYTAGRELYWQTGSSSDRTWSTDRKLAGFGGHYQVSAEHAGTIGSAFMYHPGGNVDRRTNLYYVQSADAGQTWTNAAGEPLTTPLDRVDNLALVIDYESAGLNVYIHDLSFDADGRPVILYLTSRGAQSGPDSAPYTWRVTFWDGHRWKTEDVTTSDHCYDTGSLFIAGDAWTIIGPTEPGPVAFGTGGEVAVWTRDRPGGTWSRQRQITADSRFNHAYVRRVLNGRAPFLCFWADGDPRSVSPSRLYFSDGVDYWRLPAEMQGETAEPERMR